MEPLQVFQLSAQLPCGHLFHSKCWKDWCHSSHSKACCCLCRAQAVIYYEQKVWPRAIQNLLTYSPQQDALNKDKLLVKALILDHASMRSDEGASEPVAVGFDDDDAEAYETDYLPMPYTIWDTIQKLLLIAFMIALVVFVDPKQRQALLWSSPEAA